MVPSSYMWRAALVLLVSFSACPKAPVPAVAAPLEVVKAPPDPCEADFSGSWVHAADPTWRYEGLDDGGTLELSVSRSFDGGSFADAGVATLHLRRDRDAGAFAGEVSALAGLPSGGTCAMSFYVRVTQCEDAGLTLLAASDGVIGEGCATPSRPRNPAMLEHKLTRADAGGKRQVP